MGGADSTGDVAESCFNDVDGVAMGTPFEFVQSGAEGDEKGIVGIGDAAADNNGFRIVYVD
jgi:hypothetical protein